MLEKAIDIAVQAHKGQIDKAGKPYILHPMRVMLKGQDEDEMICGILHDVCEDTPVSIDMLRIEGYNEKVLHALELLTRSHGEDYFEYIENVSKDKLATTIKLYDLTDNMNRSRIKYPTEADNKRHAKYEKAYAILTDIYKNRYEGVC